MKGVLSEGDRRDAKRLAAPPLTSPLGRLLFEAPVTALRRRAGLGQPLDDALVVAPWREARRLRADSSTAVRAGSATVCATSRVTHGHGLLRDLKTWRCVVVAFS